MKTRITHAALLALLVCVSASLGLTWCMVPPAAVPTVWPASGVVLAALLLAPTAAWPLLLLSAGMAMGLAQIWAGSTPLISLLLGLTHMAAALLAATLVRRWSRAPLAMTRLRDLVGLVVIAAVASNALTALLAAGVAWASLGAPFWPSWRIWFAADGMSIAVITPLALSWLGPTQASLRPISRGRVSEAVALGTASLLVSGGVFVVNVHAGSTGMILYSLLFPLLIWAVLRFQMRGATVVALLFASLITVGVIAGQGPFVALTTSPLAAMLAAQRYLAVIVASGYVIAALVAERATEHAAQVQAKEALRESEARFRTIFFEDGAVKLLIDPTTGRIVEANQAAVDFYGYPYDQLTQLQIQAINQLPPEAVMGEMQQAVQRHKNMFTFHANHDPLTGLLNRLAITDHVDAELARASRSSYPLSLALLDIDHFKAVNDQHGHLVGDQALRHIAQILTETVRPYDWAGRWGGEEFLVVLASTTQEDAAAIAERLRTQIMDRPLRLPDGTELRLTVSIGVACTELPAEGAGSPEVLFQQADAALYAAKHAGRNRVSCAVPALMGGELTPTEALSFERTLVLSRDQGRQYAGVPSSN